MTLANSSLAGMLIDTVTIEPFTGEDYQHKPTYGASVEYAAQLLPYSRHLIDAQGKEFDSMAQVILSGQLQVDLRSRITLPAGWKPQQPPIRVVRPLRGLGLDLTELTL